MINNIENYDFIIVGGGLVGSIAALTLSEKNYKCCLIEKKGFDNNSKNKSTFNPISLNYRSILILKKYKLWNSEKMISNNIDNLILKCHNNLNKLSLSSRSLNLSTLGYVIDRDCFTYFIQNKCKQSKKITCYDSSTIEDITSNSQNIFNIDLKYKEVIKKISSPFIIASDGHPSFIANRMGFETTHIDYNQTSYIFNCQADFKNNSAVQIINEDGSFAHIPFTDNETNLILTINNDKKYKYFISNDELNKDLIHKLFKPYLANISLSKLIINYEMKTIRSNEIFYKNVLLLGNSSQLLHPVGAQGFNLALRNIETLIDKLSSQHNDKNILLKNIFDDIANTLNIDRQNTFDYIDFSTKIICSDRILSKFTTSVFMQILKSSTNVQKSFLSKILGLNDIKYLTLKNEF
tara:strand:- start:896 stop:2119 length:1224 start_codon:yes stop_codon:yes gene_type:complete